jgi:hypothetical protein
VIRAILFLLIPLIIWGVERFCHERTGGFTLWRVSSHLSPHQHWKTSALSEEEKTKVATLLEQPFSYYGKGAQAFVFLSQDGQFVLKLFRHYRMRPPVWSYLLPALFSKEKTKRREMLLYLDFTSYALAFEQLREETGLLFVHLNKTEDLHQTLTLIDKIGIRHQIDLDQMEFLVQKRASLVPDTLQAMMEHKEINGAKAAIDELLSLLIARSKKGIFDKDPDLVTNFGFHQGKAMQIDVGRFRRDDARKEESVYKEDLIRATDPFKQWLKGKYPILAEYLDEKMHQLAL